MPNTLFEAATGADRDKLTKAAGQAAPISDEELQGKRKANVIGEETAVAKVRTAGVWVVFACVAAILLVLTWHTIKLLYAYFGEVALDPKEAKSFLLTVKDFVLVALSTLFFGALRHKNHSDKPDN